MTSEPVIYLDWRQFGVDGFGLVLDGVDRANYLFGLDWIDWSGAPGAPMV